MKKIKCCEYTPLYHETLYLVYYKKVIFTNFGMGPMSKIVISCRIFEHFALKMDPVTEFIKLGSAPFKEGTNLAPKLARSVFFLKKRLHPI